MKLEDLLLSQKIVIQITWGEQKIEFSSNVVEKDSEGAYVTPYRHNDSELQLNITEGTGVICNVFTDDIKTGQRISWRNVEITTVDRNGRVLYRIKTRGFNNVASLDDRRYNERTVVQVSGRAIDVNNNEDIGITVYDVSGVGISFHAPKTYAPKSQQLVVKFTDSIDDKTFNVQVECIVSRTSVEEGHIVVGCRLAGENRDYQLYRLLKHLKNKNGSKTNVLESDNKQVTPDNDGESVSEDEA